MQVKAGSTTVFTFTNIFLVNKRRKKKKTHVPKDEN